MPTIDSTTAVTTNLRFADIGNARADAAFTIAATTDCWTLHVLLTADQYRIVRSGNVGLTLRVFRTDDPSYRVNHAGDFLTKSPIAVSTDDLSQGYGACRFPNAADDERYVTGGWTARLLGTSSFGGIDVSQIPIWLVERRLQAPSPLPAGAFDSHALPLRFVLVSPREKLSVASGLFEDAISYFGTSVYNGLLRQAPFATRVSLVSSKTYGSDLRQGDLADLVNQYASAQGLTIFSIVNLSITVEGGIGFSMLPGPQGFTCSHSAVVSRMQPDRREETATTIAARMAHEVGHYLGLVHESACLDASVTSGDLAVCETALDNRSDPNAATILRNVMYTRWPGKLFGLGQRYQLRRAPIVQRTLTVPQTAVTKLSIKVHTGTGVRDFSDFIHGDGAGTDDNVRFYLRTSAGRTLTSNDVSSLWNDFEAGQNWSYQLDPGTSLFEEDIGAFTIAKSFNRDRMVLSGQDHWLLQGLEIWINDRQWYGNDDIATWLVNDGSGPSSFNGPLTRPARLQAMALGDSPTPQTTPSFVTPPFAAYPIALELSATAHSHCATADAWTAIAGTSPHLSFQAWIKPSDLNAEQAIVAAGDDQNRVFLRIKAGNYQAGCVVAGHETAASASIPADDLNRWIHLCGAFDGSAWMIHRNGDSMGSAPAPALPSGIAGAVNVGAYGSASGFFEGRLRNVCLWKTNRTAAQELNDLFRIDPTDPDLLAYWPLDDGEGDAAYDAGAGAHDLTLTATAWDLPTPVVANTLFLPAAPQSTPVFMTATGAKLTTAFATADITVCGWFRIGNAVSTTWERVLAATAGLVLRVRNGSYEFGLADAPADLLTVAIPAGDLGHWVHLAGQYEVSTRTWRLIRDGHPLGQSAAQQGYAVPAAGTPWTFGGRANAPPAPSSLEMRTVCLLHSALPIDRLRAAYMTLGDAVPVSTGSDGLVAYWPLNEGIGDTAYDITAGDDAATGADGTFDDSTTTWTSSDPFPSMVFVAQGASIGAALGAIHDASAAKPYTVFLGPGTYVERIVLPPYVSLIGAGEASCEITAPAADGTPTVDVRGLQELRQVTVSSTGPGHWGAYFTAVAFERGTDALLENVTIRAVNSLAQGNNVQPLAINMRSWSGVSPADRITLTNCTVTAELGAAWNAVAASGARLTMQGCTVTGATFGVILVPGGPGPFTATLVQCTVNSPTALRADYQASIVARYCHITGSVQGNVTVTP